MEWWQFVIAALAVGAFFGLLAWLRTDSSGELASPGEPGDADRFVKYDGS
jgi:hypothetical protein